MENKTAKVPSDAAASKIVSLSMCLPLARVAVQCNVNAMAFINGCSSNRPTKVLTFMVGALARERTDLG